MRLPLVPVIILIVVNLLVDLYIYRVCRRRFTSSRPARIQLWSSVILWGFLVATLCIPRRGGSEGSLLAVMWMLYTYIAFYIPKYLFVIIDLIAKIPCLFKRHRLKWMSITGAVLSVVGQPLQH